MSKLIALFCLLLVQSAFGFGADTPTPDEVREFKAQQAAYKHSQRASSKAQRKYLKAQRKALRKSRKVNRHAYRSR